MNNNIVDVIIIGAGPAGISTSLYTLRSGLSTMIIHNNNSNLKYAKNIQNYYGVFNVNGSSMYDFGINQAKKLVGDILLQEVIDVAKNDEIFKVTTNYGEYFSRNLVLAMGSKREKLNINRITEFEGRGVSYCAVCDGFFYKGKNICVIGNGEYALNEMSHLLGIASNITLLTNGRDVPNFRNDKINVISKKIVSCDGDERIRAINFEDGTNIDVDGVFIANGVATSCDLARKIGVIVDDEKIIVNNNMETNIKGLYACGDCTGGMLQVSKAVYEGALAGDSIVKCLKKLVERREDIYDTKYNRTKL